MIARISNVSTTVTSLALALVVVGLTTIAQADPLSKYDDVMVSAVVMDKCHIAISGQPSVDKVRAVGDAAWHQLWAALDTQDIGHHDENGRKADSILKKRTEADLAQGSELVSAKGCIGLVAHARAVLESYSK
jgi:hypothetical protein